MALMKVKQVAEHLGVSESFVYALLQSGRLRHHVLGKGQGGKRVSLEQLQEYLGCVEKGDRPRQKPKQPVTPPKLKNFDL